MNCPYCNSPVLLNDVAGNPWYKCGTTKTFRSASCVDREPLATELRNALARIKRLEEAIQERDKEWFQVIESILGFHPVSMTEALRIGIERIKKQKQLIKRLKEAGDAMMSEPLEYTYEQWLKVRGSKP